MRRTEQDVEQSKRKITRRGLILGGLQFGFMGILALRMRYLQVDQADQYRLLSDGNRIKIDLLPPARGQIFDRNGAVIATNEQNYRVVIRREDSRDLDEALYKLGMIIDLPPEQQDRVRKELSRANPSAPITIADRLSWEQFSSIAVNAPALPGVTPDVGLSRRYPLRGDFAHIVGYVGPVSDYDLSRIEDDDPLLHIPKFQIGKSGAESKLEQDLRGAAGTVSVEKNASGRAIRELSRTEGTAGKNVQLTIDSGLQNYVQARLHGESASAVVIDTETGDLLAVGSAPTFDPNKFVRGISIADYAELTENKYRPLANKSVQGAYPPGSTFKMVTALAALEDGVISAQDTVRCTGHTEVGGRKFHCWKRSGHGNVDLQKSLQQSCDVYYYDIAQRVGIEKITAMARRLGLGERFDIPMSAVHGGLTPTKAWKNQKYGTDWVVGDSLNASIGQGYVLASPLQLAVMTARLATGKSVTPRLLKSVDGVETPSGAGESLGLNENILRQVRAAMHDVSNTSSGTGYKMRIVKTDMLMAGKSGTSQVRNISAAERASGVVRNADLPWERRDHALFVAFAPSDKPRYAVAVVVEHGGGGSTAAAPIVRDVMLQTLYGGTPPLDAYPQKDRASAKAQQDKIRELLRASDQAGTEET